MVLAESDCEGLEAVGDRMKKMDRSGIEKKSKDLALFHQEQLTIFDFLEPNQPGTSSTIELYDAIPKYVWGNQKRSEDGSLRPIEREFKFRGAGFNLTLFPATIKQGNGYLDYYPGRREEAVEDALRKMAAHGQGAYLDEEAGVVFTLHELQKELKSVGQEYNKTQIKEAITILARSHIELSNEDGTKIIEAPLFSTIGLSSFDDWRKQGKDAKCFVRFNPLVTSSIKKQSFRLFNYAKNRQIGKDTARWLHKRMSHMFIQASPLDKYSIKLSTIVRDSGMDVNSRIRKAAQHVEACLNELIDKKIILSFKKSESLTPTKGRPRIEDVLYEITPHPEFANEIRTSNKILKCSLTQK